VVYGWRFCLAGAGQRHDNNAGTNLDRRLLCMRHHDINLEFATNIRPVTLMRLLVVVKFRNLRSLA